MANHFYNLLEGILLKSQLHISYLPLLTSAETHQLLREWNDNSADYDKNVCLHELFEAQVKLTPQGIAVVFQGQQLTYEQLNQQANQLAHYLQKLGVAPETLVGICVNRSLEMVIAILGILKAGGAYVPLDPTYPKERLEIISADCKLSLILTQQSLLEKLPANNAHLICLDTHKNTFNQESEENPHSSVTSQNLAYIIYTSGSTGKPKGVQIAHTGVINLLNSMTKKLGLTSEDVSGAIASMAFDISVAEIFLPLSLGGKVVVITREVVLDGKQLSATLTNAGITIMQTTPATWEILLKSHWQGSNKLKVICGGEALTQKLAKDLQNKCASLWNIYGPTENSVWSSIYQVESPETVIPIGKPFANIEIYILDAHLQPVPIGVFGEIHLGGVGLTRGYLNLPQLTQEKFIPHPFKNDPQARLYKTGDLARYLSDGNIEFLSRIDHQVKVRGFRIELGEIESVIATYPGVKETVVIVREDIPNDKRLVAYIIPQQPELITSDDLRSFLNQKLPNYMIPNAFVFLATFPLTPNRKIDRSSLPAPQHSRSQLENLIAQPTDKIEQELHHIWLKLLQIQPINTQDNFFALGGHSLLAVKLATEIERTFNKNIPLSLIFQSPTIEQIAKFLREDKFIAADSCLMPINQSTGHQPLFFINSAQEARSLAAFLPEDQPFYCLNIFGLSNYFKEQLSELTLEIIAAKFVEDLLKIQPQGPYLLITFCGDAGLTLEIAQQLQAQGHKIAMLAFIDSFWQRSKAKNNLFLQQIKRFGLKYILEKSRLRIQTLKDSLIRQFQQINSQIFLNNNKNIIQELQDIELLKTYYQLRNSYQPKNYQGKILLLLTTESLLYYSSQTTTFATEGVELIEIPGYHHTIFEQTYIGKLSEIIKKYLPKSSK